MAGVILNFGLPIGTEVGLAADTAKVVLQFVAATDHRARLLSWGISFDGTSGTSEPVEVTVERLTGGTAGTGGTAIAAGQALPIADVTVTNLYTSCNRDTAAPSGGTRTILQSDEIHPQGGQKYVYDFGENDYAMAGGAANGGVILIVAKTPAGAPTINCKPWLRVEL